MRQKENKLKFFVDFQTMILLKLRPFRGGKVRLNIFFSRLIFGHSNYDKTCG